jgi:hypothetical protein
MYHAETSEIFTFVVNEFDRDDASTITKLQEIFNDIRTEGAKI